VANYAFKTVTEETKALIKKALLERNALRGICRFFDVSLTWLLSFVVELDAVLPADLGIDLQSVGDSDAVSLYSMTVEANEMWSFVAKKSNKQWLWIALDSKTRHIIAFHVGDRSKESARQLWEKIPGVYRQHATFYTDLYDYYVDVLPEKQRIRVTKNTCLANHIERFNCTMLQRVFTAGQGLLGLLEKIGQPYRDYPIFHLRL
jgi:insertion element IS1 protein InsB